MKKSFIFLLMFIILIISCNKEKDVASSEKKVLSEKSPVKWPLKPIEVIVHAQAGGDTDFNTRTLAKYFERITGQPMLIKNMEGGGGSLATSYVKDAKPDGYTLLCTHTGPMIINEISGLVNYNFSSFEISSVFAIDKSLVLVATKQSNVRSIDGLLNKTKLKQNEFIYSSELGSITHLQGLILEERTNIKLKIVDTGSLPDKIEALLDGYTELSLLSYGSIINYEKSGDLLVLAQFNQERNEYLSHVPTMKEKGIDIFIEKPYIAAFPLGTDRRIVDKMDSIIAQIINDEEYIKELSMFKQPVSYYSKDEATLYLKNIRNSLLKYRNLLKK